MIGDGMLDGVFSGSGGVAETLLGMFSGTAVITLSSFGDYDRDTHQRMRTLASVEIPFMPDYPGTVTASMAIKNEPGTRTSSPDISGFAPMTALEGVDVLVGESEITFDGKTYTITKITPVYSGRMAAMVKIDGKS